MVIKDAYNNIVSNISGLTGMPIILGQMTPEDRPCDKAWNSTDGVKSLSTTELISLIIGCGCKDTPATVLAQNLFARFGNSLCALSKASLQDLSSEKGIGKSKAVAVAAALELGMRCRDEQNTDSKCIRCADDVFWLMRGILEKKHTEEFWIIVLNRRNRVIGKPVRISAGTSGSTPVTVKMVFKRVLEFGDEASSVVFVHNHPDGLDRPSADDISLTALLCETARSIVDIDVFDHVIVTPEGKYYSFKENSLL